MTITENTATATATPPAPAPAARVNYAKAAPKAFRALLALDAASREGLDPALVELVQIRSSLLNNCAYCLDMHIKDARKAGEREERLYLLSVWREAPAGLYSAKEQAALALTEAVTRIGDGVPDAVYGRAAEEFEEAELAQLLSLIFTINTWNRIAITTRKVPGIG
ncbi:carboxymuconolactone decarboxylase family protein [Streptomyces sp. CB03911]|uniref:carboxymuconolactone decarboxylase family protein n=1 Tax=Streptomyces sp. CB03911 TaxID=1804758 RepID=UPI00093DF52B|nr:carboxymuconolactone decarboxylase family protein [Streptomyces sp. CB03911]OKI24471.1 4-carboxymuconolactone decarboxylase [Streptomyces sp. CB03911]